MTLGSCHPKCRKWSAASSRNGSVRAGPARPSFVRMAREQHSRCAGVRHAGTDAQDSLGGWAGMTGIYDDDFDRGVAARRQLHEIAKRHGIFRLFVAVHRNEIADRLFSHPTITARRLPRIPAFAVEEMRRTNNHGQKETPWSVKVRNHLHGLFAIVLSPAPAQHHSTSLSAPWPARAPQPFFGAPSLPWLMLGRVRSPDDPLLLSGRGARLLRGARGAVRLQVVNACTAWNDFVMLATCGPLRSRFGSRIQIPRGSADNEQACGSLRTSLGTSAFPSPGKPGCLH